MPFFFPCHALRGSLLCGPASRSVCVARFSSFLKKKRHDAHTTRTDTRDRPDSTRNTSSRSTKQQHTNAHQTDRPHAHTRTHTSLAIGERCQSTDDTAHLTPTLTQPPPRASASAWGTIACASSTDPCNCNCNCRYGQSTQDAHLASSSALMCGCTLRIRSVARSSFARALVGRRVFCPRLRF